MSFPIAAQQSSASATAQTIAVGPSIDARFKVVAAAQTLDDLAASTYFIDTYAAGKPVHDLHEDGLDDRDFVNWLTTGPFSQTVAVDLDADGQIGCDEIASVLSDGLAIYGGDSNADGIVDAQDIAQAAMLVGSQPVHLGVSVGDMNGDGTVDVVDVELTASSVGMSSFAVSHSMAAERILEISSEFCGGGGGPGSGGIASIYDPPDHSQGVSETYPGHIFGYSKPSVIPNDHDFGISTTWPISQHTAPWSKVFPPNHYGSVSHEWRWPDDPNHAYHVSVQSPPHSRQTSQYWPPTHTLEVSEGWYPDSVPPLERHAIQSSRTWPPNHSADNSGAIGEHDGMWSINVPRSDHLADFSATWDHNEDLSGIAWPPNHVKSPSSGWPDSHRANTSIHWPPSHMTLASGEWEDDTDTNWPPNHMPDFSATWPDPTPGVPLFPPDHTIWTTAQDILDLLPGDGGDDNGDGNNNGEPQGGSIPIGSGGTGVLQ